MTPLRGWFGIALGHTISPNGFGDNFRLKLVRWGTLQSETYNPRSQISCPLAGQFAQEFALVHVVFESLVAVDEDDGDFVGEPAAQLVVAFHINLPPSEATASMQLGQRLFDDLTQMTALTRVDDDLARLRHGRSLARGKALGN